MVKILRTVANDKSDFYLLPQEYKSKRKARETLDYLQDNADYIIDRGENWLKVLDEEDGEIQYQLVEKSINGNWYTPPKTDINYIREVMEDV
jgi:hypothetical protein